jgi:hypothetical protein
MSEFEHDRWCLTRHDLIRLPTCDILPCFYCRSSLLRNHGGRLCLFKRTFWTFQSMGNACAFLKVSCMGFLSVALELRKRSSSDMLAAQQRSSLLDLWHFLTKGVH